MEKGPLLHWLLKSMTLLAHCDDAIASHEPTGAVARNTSVADVPMMKS